MGYNWILAEAIWWAHGLGSFYNSNFYAMKCKQKICLKVEGFYS